MNWSAISLASSLVFLLSLLIVPFRFKYKKDKFFTPFKIVFLGTLLSAFILFLPLYMTAFEGYDYSFYTALFSSLHHVFRLFALDGEYLSLIEMAEEFITDSNPTLSIYVLLATVLYIVAPVLTFTFLLSMLKNLFARISYRCVLFGKETHVFSELNDKSVALAGSIVNREIGDSTLKKISKIFRKNIIVFTDVDPENDDSPSELIVEAKKLGAILFYKDIESLAITKGYKKRKVKVYLISEDENAKIRQANSIMKNYDLPGIELYVFSESTQSQIILRHKKVENIKVVRVNDIRTLIYHNLDTYGMRLFDKAYENNLKKNTENSVISAVIVGFGRYGKEMLKALSWFCQYPKFDLVINVFDSDPSTEDYFKFHFPDMAKRSGNYVSGEDNYTINFHSGININSPEFTEKFNTIENPTYIFVCLGNDEDNINAALNVRTLCERRGLSIDKVDVETVVYDSHSAELMSCVWDKDKIPAPLYDTEEDRINAKASLTEKNSPCDEKGSLSSCDNNTYGIHIIGDLDNFYSFDTIVNPKWEQAGMTVNRRYFVQSMRAAKAKVGEKASDKKENSLSFKEEKQQSDKAADKGFWQKEYNYRSSVTKAIHEKLKLKLHQFTDYGFVLKELTDPPKAIEDWEDAEIFKYADLEHPRWCAYIRSEGYIKRTDGGNGRNELAKTHSDLIPTEELEIYKKFYDL